MYKYRDKTNNIKTQVNYMLVKSLNMFKYENLPDTLPQIEIEKLLQTRGLGFITKHNDELYIFSGSLSGALDVYGNYTKFNVSNPNINLNKEFELSDGSLIKNDDLALGLLPIYERYVTMMVENEISMVMHSYNNRINRIISAGDDSTKESAEKYIDNIIDGKLGIIGESRIFEGIKVDNPHGSNSNQVTHMIEYQQYLKASMFNEIGLNANFNMKRERLTSNETELNTDILYPFIDDMLENRRVAIDKVNELFDTNIEVNFNGVWLNRIIELEREIAALDEVESDVVPLVSDVDVESESDVDVESEPEPEPETETETETDLTPDTKEVLIDVIIEELEDLKDEDN